MSADYIYKKKDGTTISCYGSAKQVLDGDLGMIIKFDDGNVVILWPVTGLSWEDEENIEVISESQQR